MIKHVLDGLDITAEIRRKAADALALLSVNVNDDVVRIKTEVTDAGSKVEAVYRLQELDEPPRPARRAVR